MKIVENEVIGSFSLTYHFMRMIALSEFSLACIEHLLVPDSVLGVFSVLLILAMKYYIIITLFAKKLSSGNVK